MAQERTTKAQHLRFPLPLNTTGWGSASDTWASDGHVKSKLLPSMPRAEEDTQTIASWGKQTVLFLSNRRKGRKAMGRGWAKGSLMMMLLICRRYQTQLLTGSGLAS